MEELASNDIFSNQQDGAIVNAETIAEPGDAGVAEVIFQVARMRLMDVNQWHHLAGNSLAHFQLTDQHGNIIDGPVSEGCHFRINIPGPGTQQGGGFDWVQVERVVEYAHQNTKGVAIQVRPSSNPLTKSDITAHFYSGQSTSIFAVSINNRRVTASVYDKNLKPNNDSDKAVDLIRNAVIGTVGILGLSKLQWQRLTDGLLEQSK